MCCTCVSRRRKLGVDWFVCRGWIEGVTSWFSDRFRAEEQAPPGEEGENKEWEENKVHF